MPAAAPTTPVTAPAALAVAPATSPADPIALAATLVSTGTAIPASSNQQNNQ